MYKGAPAERVPVVGPATPNKLRQVCMEDIQRYRYIAFSCVFEEQ